MSGTGIGIGVTRMGVEAAGVAKEGVEIVAAEEKVVVVVGGAGRVVRGVPGGGTMIGGEGIGEEAIGAITTETVDGMIGASARGSGTMEGQIETESGNGLRSATE